MDGEGWGRVVEAVMGLEGLEGLVGLVVAGLRRGKERRRSDKVWQRIVMRAGVMRVMRVGVDGDGVEERSVALERRLEKRRRGIVRERRGSAAFERVVERCCHSGGWE